MEKFEDQLDEVRTHLDRSRNAAQRAKNWMDVGYPSRIERDQAIEELTQGLDQLVDIVAKLAREVAAQKIQNRRLDSRTSVIG